MLDFCLMHIHYGEMTSLPEGNPSVYEYFQNGVFSVQIGDHSDLSNTCQRRQSTWTAGGTWGSISNQEQLASNTSLPGTVVRV